MLQDYLRCPNHQQKNIIGFCVSKSCKKGRACCLKCLNEHHYDHAKEVIEQEEVQQLLEKNSNGLESVLFQIKEIESILTVIKISFQSLIQSTPMNNTQLFIEKIDALLRTDESQLKVCTNAFEATMKQIRNYVEKNIEKLNQIQQLQQIIIQLILIKQEGCSKSIQLFENILISQTNSPIAQITKIQSLLTIIFQSLEDQQEKKVELIQNYQFSANLTNQNISVTLKKAEQVNNTCNYALTLIQPSLPKSGSFTIKIKIVKLVGWICLGLCKKVIVSLKNYLFPSQGTIGHGCYIISAVKQHISHDDFTKNCQQITNFSFTTNDVIQLTADMDKACITWNNETKKQQYDMSISLDQELCFCAVLLTKGDSIEIIE